MQYEIGEIVAKIRQMPDSKGMLSLTAIKAELASRCFLVVAAIRWMARENKISIAAKGKSFIISLI